MAFADLFKRRPAATNAQERTESGRGHSTNPRLLGHGTTKGYIVPDEYKPELIGEPGMRVWDQMWRSDPDVFRNWSMLISLFAGSTYDVTPYGGDQADDDAIMHAEFVKWALFEAMSPKFPNHLMQALRMLRHGFVPFEQVWRPEEWTWTPPPVKPKPVKPGEQPKGGKDDGKKLADPPASTDPTEPAEPAQPEPVTGTYLVLDRLALRLPRSIYRWEADGERLIRLTQSTVANTEILLEAKDLLYYRWGAEGDNWEGTSPFRHAFKPWKFKETLEVVEAIGLERFHVGIPIGYPAEGASPELKDDLENALKNIRSNASNHIRMPGPKEAGWEVEILTPHGGAGGADIRGAIDGHRDGISAAFIQEFMRQGQKNVGTNATAQTQENPFMAWAEAMCGVIVEDPINEQLIPRLIALNFKDAKGCPKLKASVIDPMALEQLAAATGSMVSAGLISVDDPLEDYLRERFDFPPADPEARQQRKAQAEEQRQAELEGMKNPVDNGTEEKVHERPLPGGAKQRTRTVKKLTDTPEGPLTDRELDAIRGVLDNARPTAARFTGLTANFDREQLQAQFEALFTDVYEQGHATVLAELTRQAQGAVTLKQKTINDPTAPKTLARLAVEAVARTVQGVRDRLALLKSPPEVVEAEVTQAVQRVVEREAQDTATLAFNGGRKAAAEEQGAIVMGALYTAILDDNSCGQCRKADDDQIRALHDEQLIPVPNPLCEGWTRCRCLHVYVLSDDVPFRP